MEPAVITHWKSRRPNQLSKTTLSGVPTLEEWIHDYGAEGQIARPGQANRGGKDRWWCPWIGPTRRPPEGALRWHRAISPASTIARRQQQSYEEKGHVPRGNHQHEQGEHLWRIIGRQHWELKSTIQWGQRPTSTMKRIKAWQKKQ